MIGTAQQRRARGLALQQADLQFGAWLDLHDDLEAALFELIAGAERCSPEAWPLALSSDIRAVAVAAHTVGSYQGGGWAVGVLANGLHVLPFVPEALRAVGYPVQAEAAERSVSLFADGFDFRAPSGEAQTKAITAIERWDGYAGFLEEIETALPSDWEALGVPERIKIYASKLRERPVWA